MAELVNALVSKTNDFMSCRFDSDCRYIRLIFYNYIILVFLYSSVIIIFSFFYPLNIFLFDFIPFVLKMIKFISSNSLQF